MIRIVILLVGIMLMSCGTPKKADDNNADKVSDATEISSTNTILDLTAQLRKLPGISVKGSGENATFQIRGANTISSGSAPLFIVDGQQVQNYASAYRMVQPSQFKSARILKNSSDTSFYGSRGANGVIVIKTKK